MKSANQIEPEKRIKITVLQKGLVFLSVAVVLAGLFIFQLFELVLKAERLATTEAALSDVVALADQCFFELAVGWREISLLIFSPNASDKTDPELFRKRTSSLFAQLKPRLEQFPGTGGMFEDTKAFTDDEYRVIKSLHAQSRSRSMMESMHILSSFSPKIGSLGKKLQNARDDLDNKRASINRTREEERLTREQLKQQIIGGAIAAILFFIVATLVFLNDITQRLTVLVSNAQQIPTGKFLSEKVGGTDELAYLDNVLHEASAQLLKSAEYRKSLMEMIAHDLRSPLSASRLSLQLLLDSKEGADQTNSDKIRSVRDNLARIISLVEDLLTIDKLEAGELALNRDWINIKQLVDESIEVISSLAAVKTLTITNEVAAEYVEADKMRITQVLNNLLTNAIKFSHHSGRVRVCSEPGKKVLKIMVIDEGIGLEPKDHDRLFSKFFQADQQDSNQGFGLGLAITKLIVEAHGGHVGMSSAPKEGSTFWFTLPMDDQQPDHTVES